MNKTRKALEELKDLIMLVECIRSELNGLHGNEFNTFNQLTSDLVETQARINQLSKKHGIDLSCVTV